MSTLEATFDRIELPLTTLHYVKCGSGPPLIMPPATMSELEEWMGLVQFVAQRYTVYFFELPGYGQSTPFPVSFRTALVAETVEAMIDKLGYDTVSLMGFSFGGLLTLQVLENLRERIEKVILVSPCVSKRALRASGPHLWMGRNLLIPFLQQPPIQRGIFRLIHSNRVGDAFIEGLKRLGKVEDNAPFNRKLRDTPLSSLEVLSYQLGEILNYEPPQREKPYSHPCYFAMSMYDPLLDFDFTLDFLEGHFENLFVERFDFPYHRPPELPTLEDLNRDYARFLEII